MRRERENCFDDRALSTWFYLPDIRAQRIFALHSHATAYRDCRAVPGRDCRIAVVCCAFPAADRARPASSSKSVRSVGAYDPGRHRFQHSLYPHFHGACRFASGFARHDLVVSCGLECFRCPARIPVTAYLTLKEPRKRGSDTLTAAQFEQFKISETIFNNPAVNAAR